MARTSCRMAARSFPTSQGEPLGQVADPVRSLAAVAPHAREVRPAPSPEDPRDESLTAVYSAAGSDHAPDGRRPSGWLGRLPAIARLCLASRRLPYNPGANVLSRSQPGRYALFGNRSARAPARTNSRTEPNEFHELL